MNLVSVIIPVYNVEQYLDQCLDSVINQTYSCLEIIVVNDGSTDNSKSILEKYEKADPRIKLINKTNGGQSSARNMGLDVATGEWVSFVDADDWIELDMYEKLLSISDGKEDFICCGHYDVYGDTKQVGCQATNSVYALTQSQMYKRLFGSDPILRFEEWNKLFRRSIIGEVRFKEGQFYEEVYFDRVVFAKCSMCKCIDTPLYNYRRNRKGSTSTFFNDKKMFIFGELFDFSQDLKVNERDVSNQCLLYGLETALTFYKDAKRYNAPNNLISSLEEYILKFWESSKFIPLRLRIHYYIYKFRLHRLKENK